MTHDHYMQKALAIAEDALAKDEFPVGCIVVHEDRIVAVGERVNTQGQTPSEIDHAEMIALRNLENAPSCLDRGRMTVYATLEPCLMCFGALLLSGIGTIVYAYEDIMGGGTGCDCSSLPPLYSQKAIRIVPGVCRAASLSLFKAYFARPHISYWRDSLLARYTLSVA
jgi:tRNA(adenine34) deaminase